jgi:predicted P-loop ATPase
MQGDLGSKDAAMQTRGVWIIELSELDNLSHAEVARIKAFMSRTTDRFRPPYGMRLVESPRPCVFAGTVNRSSYLRDETGGRRFWPVVCGQIDVDAFACDRDQLWAEAKVRFESGSFWWLDTMDLVQLARNAHSSG